MDPRYPVGQVLPRRDVTPAKRQRLDRPDRRAARATSRTRSRRCRPAARHAVPRRRMDGAAGGASPGRQPPERLHADQAGADRRQAGDQDLRGATLGRAAGRAAPPTRPSRWRSSTACTTADHPARVADARTVRSPGAPSRHGATITVDWLVQMYAWHCRHHLAHIGLVSGEDAGEAYRTRRFACRWTRGFALPWGPAFRPRCQQSARPNGRAPASRRRRVRRASKASGSRPTSRRGSARSALRESRRS